MQKIRVAINGFGRIGRTFFRLAHGHPIVEVVAINDLGSREALVYLLTHDTVYGQWPFKVVTDGDGLVVDGRKVHCSSEKELQKLPWKELAIDIVVEATGLFTSYEKARGHIDAGAQRVVITAPVTDTAPDGKTVLVGVNEEELRSCVVSSNASCTTNAVSPLIAILDEAIGVKKALLNTTHAYTASQSLTDGPHRKDPREGRAASQNIVPSGTGAAIATTLVHTQLAHVFDGISVRVPVTVGSLVDLTFVAKRPTSVDEVNLVLRDGALKERWRGLFTTTTDPVVSSDIIGSRVASIADLSFTKVVDGDLVKVLAWYDNEVGYTQTLISHVEKVASFLHT